MYPPIIYQRLSENAPDLDIDDNHINIVQAADCCKIERDGSLLLDDLLIKLPATLYGIVTLALPGVIIDNNFIKPGHYSTLHHIRFYSMGSHTVEVLRGKILGSIFFFPTEISTQDLQLQKTALVIHANIEILNQSKKQHEKINNRNMRII